MSTLLSNRIIFILSLAGAFVAGHLTLAHLHFVDIGCGASGGCEEVARHWSARGFGIPGLSAIPTAAFGLAMYVSLMVLSFLRAASTSGALMRRAGIAIWWLAFAGVLVTAWLTYMEAFVINAWCRWCLVSAALVTLIFLASTAERVASGLRAQGEVA
jgi:uncharacterized membrane protein